MEKKNKLLLLFILVSWNSLCLFSAEKLTKEEISNQMAYQNYELAIQNPSICEEIIFTPTADAVANQAEFRVMAFHAMFMAVKSGEITREHYWEVVVKWAKNWTELSDPICAKSQFPYEKNEKEIGLNPQSGRDGSRCSFANGKIFESENLLPFLDMEPVKLLGINSNASLPLFYSFFLYLLNNQVENAFFLKMNLSGADAPYG